MDISRDEHQIKKGTSMGTKMMRTGDLGSSLFTSIGFFGMLWNALNIYWAMTCYAAPTLYLPVLSSQPQGIRVWHLFHLHFNADDLLGNVHSLTVVFPIINRFTPGGAVKALFPVMASSMYRPSWRHPKKSGPSSPVLPKFSDNMILHDLAAIPEPQEKDHPTNHQKKSSKRNVKRLIKTNTSNKNITTVQNLNQTVHPAPWKLTEKWTQLCRVTMPAWLQSLQRSWSAGGCDSSPGITGFVAIKHVRLVNHTGKKKRIENLKMIQDDTSLDDMLF